MSKKKFKKKITKSSNKNRKNLFAGLILVGLMVFAVVGFAFQGAQTTQGSFVFNGFDFNIQRSPTNTLYFTTIENQEIGFYNDPFFVSDQTFPDELRASIIQSNNIIFTYKPLDQLDVQGIDFRLTNALINDVSNFAQRQVTRANIESDPFDPLPIRTCSDADNETLVFKLTYGENDETDLIVENSPNCFNINGFNFDFIILRDYIIYTARGII